MAEAGTGANAPENPQLTALDQQIAAHQTADKNRSWVGYVASQFWTGDRTSLDGLEKVAQQAHDAQLHGDTTQLSAITKQAQELIDADKKAVTTQDEIGNYTSSGLKMATLFLGAGRFALSGAGLIGMESAGTAGWLGLAGTVGVSAADRVRIGDTGTEMASHLAIGASEGLVTKALANGIMTAGIANPMTNATLGETLAGLGSTQLRADATASIASRFLSDSTAKGVLLSTTLRGVNLAYQDSTYRDAQGNYNGTAAVGNLLGGTFDLKAIAIDTAMFGTVNAFSRVLTGGQAVRPLYHTMLTSGTLGLGSGAYGEISKEWGSGQPLNWGEIGRRSLIQGGIYTVAGIPGGLVADPAFRANPVASVRSDVTGAVHSVSTSLSETASAMGAALTPGDGMMLQPAYATALDTGTRGNLLHAAGTVRTDTISGADPKGAQIMHMDGHSGEGGHGALEHGAVISHDHGVVHQPVAVVHVPVERSAAEPDRAIEPQHNADTSIDRALAPAVITQEAAPGQPAVLASAISDQGDLFAASSEGVLVAPLVRPADVPLGHQFSLLGEGEMFGADGHLKPGAITGAPIKDMIPDQWTDIRREAESKLSPDELAAIRRNTENFVRQLSSDNPNYFETQMSYQLLAEHPEVDSHMADLYMESVRNKDMPLRAGVRRLLDGFYRPANAMEREPVMRSLEAAEQVNHITDWLDTDLLNKLPGALERSAENLSSMIRTARENGLNVSDAIRQYARMTDNQHYAAIIDRALVLSTPEGQTAEPTNYAALVSEFATQRRSLPLTHEQYQLLSDGTQQYGAADTPPATAGVWSALAAWPRAAGTEGLTGAALLEGEAQGPAANAPISADIAEALADLKSADASKRSARVLQLARSLSDPSSPQWFDTWKQSWLETANDAVRSVMNSPAVQALPAETVRRCLSFGGSSLMDNVGTMRELTNLFTTSAAETTPITLDTASIGRIVELARNRAQVDAVLKTIKTGKAGATNQDYKDWLVKELPSATSLDAVIGQMEPGKFGGERRGMPIKFLLDKGLPDSPDTVKALMDRAAADNSFNLSALAAKLGYGKDTSAMAKVVREQLSRNVTNAELNPAYLTELSFLPRYFRNSPQAATLMKEMSRCIDPQTFVNLLRAPDAPKEPAQAPGKGQQRAQISPDTQKLIQGYKDFLGELIPRAAANMGVTEANVTQVPAEQLQQVAQALMAQLELVSKTVRARPATNAEAEAAATTAVQAAVQQIVPKDDPAYGRLAEFAVSLVTSTASMVPREQPAANFAPQRPPQNQAPLPAAELDPAPPADQLPAKDDLPDAATGTGQAPVPGPARESDATGGVDRPDQDADKDPIIVLNPSDPPLDPAADQPPADVTEQIVSLLTEAEAAAVAEDTALHELDTSMELGGSSALFRRLDTLFEKQPIDSSAYRSMLADQLNAFGSHVPRDRGYVSFKDPTEAQLFAEHVAQHIAENLDDADKVSFRLQSIGSGEDEQVLPVIDVTTANGRSASGTPVLNLDGQVIGLSPLLGVDAPVPGTQVATPAVAPAPKPRSKPAAAPAAAAPVDQALMEAQLAQLTEKWGARRGGRRDGE